MVSKEIAISDFKGLQSLKRDAQTDAKKALPEVAKQFEAIFLQSMLKSMRSGQHFLDDSSPFKSKTEQSFQDMLDAQYAISISGTKGVGLATMLAKQLERNVGTEVEKPETRLMDAPIAKVLNTSISPTINSVKPMTAPLAMAKPVNPVTSEKKPAIDDFVKSIWPYAQQAASVLGLDPKILMAQAALETGWGQYIAKDQTGSSYNMFNIKASGKNPRQEVNVKTTEYIADNPIKTTASFKKYPSVAHSFNDYISLLKGSDRYENALAKAGDAKTYINELHRAGYATDPHYASKIMAIYNGDELEQSLQRNGFMENQP